MKTESHIDSQFLTTFIEINDEITSILDLDQLLNKIAELTQRIVPYQIFAILLVDSNRQDLYYRFAIGHSSDVVENLRIPFGTGIVGTAALERRPVVVEDVRTDPRYIKAVEAARSELAVPLISKHRLVGVLDIESPVVGYFKSEQVQLLNLLASQIAVAIENARIYARVSENERRMDREMKIAREIQQRLMPEEIPSVPPLDIGVVYRPAAHLGGDLYDFIRFDDKRLAVVVGDVAGKGAPAALYGALTSGIIRTRATRKYPPAQMLELVNKSLYSRPIESQYCALLYAIYDPETQRITLANSGLPYPLLVRDGTPRFLELAGIPVGLFSDSTYQEFDLQLHAGDVLSFCSDGLVEARNESNDDFGLKRFAEVVRAHSGKAPDEIVQAVNDAVDEFAGPVPPHDDRTLIVIKVGS